MPKKVVDGEIVFSSDDWEVKVGELTSTAKTPTKSNHLCVARDADKKDKLVAQQAPSFGTARKTEPMSAIARTTDSSRTSRHVRSVPGHKVAALQPAAREQEPRDW